jgi:hypothetical protein
VERVFIESVARILSLVFKQKNYFSRFHSEFYFLWVRAAISQLETISNGREEASDGLYTALSYYASPCSLKLVVNQASAVTLSSRSTSENMLRKLCFLTIAA